MVPKAAAILADGTGLLSGATLPLCLVDGADLAANRDGLARADIQIERGRIAAIRPAGAAPAVPGLPRVDMDGGMVMPLFVDMHTHLDKGHIWPRRRNPDGRFMSALENVRDDRIANWTAEDVRRRMDFALRCAYAHGTRAIRTHIDSIPPQEAISWPLFAEIRAEWAGRIDLQAVVLVGPDSMMDPEVMDHLARVAKAHGGLLGGAIAVWPDASRAVGNVVAAAARHDIDIDLHIDETENPEATALRALADAVIDQSFSGQVTAGHCCSITRQDAETRERTLDRVAEAGIAVVSLPMCNMFLQDREGVTAGGGGTPRWRGVTLVHEMKARGIRVAVASDNTRDPFYAYGDLDGLEVLREATRILQLDHPVGDWPGVMSRVPADIMGLPERGRIAVGLPADLALFGARTWTELHARPQADRLILRDGRPALAPLPDYRELDDLLGAPE